MEVAFGRNAVIRIAHAPILLSHMFIVVLAFNRRKSTCLRADQRESTYLTANK
jgi:hypothetical protein